MALFPRSSADAVRAAVDMQRELVVYNGHRAPVVINEVFAADPMYDLKMKRCTRRYFEQGVRLYLKGKTQEALRYFKAVLRARPANRAAQYYVTACRKRAG
jgi:hypothetical protein